MRNGNWKSLTTSQRGRWFFSFGGRQRPSQRSTFQANDQLFKPHSNALAKSRTTAEIWRPKLASSHDYFIFHSARAFSSPTSQQCDSFYFRSAAPVTAYQLLAAFYFYNHFFIFRSARAFAFSSLTSQQCNFSLNRDSVYFRSAAPVMCTQQLCSTLCASHVHSATV